jgi:membrane protease YdiL (CAAX protease family)
MLKFIKRERLYILMLFFIVAINVMNSGHTEKTQPEEKKPLSAMTLKEIGVTDERVKDFFESEKLSAGFFKYSIVIGFFIFVTAIISNLGFFFRRKKIDFKPNSHKGPVSWGISDLVRASIIIIFMAYLVGLIEALLVRTVHLELGSNLRMILSTFFIDIIVLAVVLYFVVVKCRERLPALGLRFESILNNILSGIAAYIFIVPLLFMVLIFSIWFLDLLGYSPPSQPIFEVFMEEKRSRVLFFLTIFVSLFGPIIEEMFFRGFMYSAIKKRLGFLGAAFLSASIFSLLHTNIVSFLPIMMLGALLAYLYERTGSLVAPITVHIVHNSVIVGFMFFIKELI